MGTICKLSVPVRELALARTFQTCPDAIVECEQLIEPPPDTSMPLIRVREISPDVFETALAEDSTVVTYTQLAGTENEWLYKLEWSDTIQLVLEFFTIEGAVILDAMGSADGWRFRVLFSSRDDLTETVERCETHNISLSIHSIRDFDSESASSESARFVLTADQHEGLLFAYEQGYFEVPRVVGLEDLATDIGISHQALSERLRRGHETLIRETLLSGNDPLMADQQPATDADYSDDENAPPVDD